MKNIKAFRQTAFFVLLCALAVLPGCNNVLDPSPETSAATAPGTQGKAAVSIVVNNGGQRTVFPEAEIAVYKLYGNRTDTEPELLAEFSSTSTSVILEPGNWSFTLSAYNQDDALIMQGAAEDQAIIVGAANSVTFVLSPPMEGEGDIEISFNFPRDAGITSISILGDIPPDEPVTVEAGEETFTWEKKNVNSGFHFVSFKFYRGAELATVFSEMIQVSGNMTSRKIINLSGYELAAELFSVAEGSSLAEKLSWLGTNAESGGKYLIEVSADEDIAPTSLSWSGKSGITISMIGTGEPRTIGLSENGSMFTIGDGVTLSLDNNITLTGRSNNTSSLVVVETGGSLILNSGSSISGNTNSSYFGGGVYVRGTFTMNGGEISGNSASSSSSSSGGGVYVEDGGSFTMSGGEISGNSASSYSYSSSYGGGVYVGAGTFTMSGGEISGNSASSSSSYGGGVYISTGTFIKTGGILTGYASDKVNGNRVSATNGSGEGGHAVYTMYGDVYKDSTAGTTADLFFDYNNNKPIWSGEWDNTAGITLSTGTWYHHSIPTDNAIEYSLYVTAGTTYYIWWNDSKDGSEEETLDITVDAVYADGTAIFTGADSAWDTPQIFTASEYGTVTLKVYPRNAGDTGTYAIMAATDNGTPVVTFDKNGGDTEASPRTKEVVKPALTVSELPMPPARPDYAFTGWNTQADGSGTAFTTLTEITEDITVYAQWKKLSAELVIDTWADGSISTPDGEQWFSFTATADTQFIHTRSGSLSDLYVQLYDSNGDTVGDMTNLYSSDTYVSRSVNSDEIYYIKVTPLYSNYSGNYEIGFTATPVPPELSLAELTVDTWKDGNIPTSNGEEWFAFRATDDIQYIHVRFSTLSSLSVQLYDSNGNTVGDHTYLYLYGDTTYVSRSVNSGEIYYIKVTPSYGYSGTYEIGFTATLVPPELSLTELTFDTWEGGNIPSSGVREEWFTFRATAATQYIHARFSTLSNLNVQLYNSNWKTVGDTTYLYESVSYVSRSVNPNETYYIKVTLYSSDSGNYRLSFNSSPTPPVSEITIITQPSDITVTAGKITGSLTVGVEVTEGAALYYQWYYSTSDSNSGGTTIPGATDAIITIPTGLAQGTYYLYCEVSADGTESVSSRAATVTVNAPDTPVPVISITGQPSDITVTEGSITGSLSVGASVTENAALSYQWYYNTTASNSGGMAVPGETSFNFTIPASLTAGTYYFYCVVNADGAESVSSSAATVTVNAPDTPVPVIIIMAQSGGYELTEGSISGDLSVEASVTEGVTLFYQWYESTSGSNSDGTAVDGATGASFTIPTSLTAGTYYYYCVVSADGAESVSSAAAAVTVYTLPEAEVVIQLGNMNDPSLITQTATAYSNTNKTFTVSGTDYTAYQWYVDGIPGGASAAYTFNRLKGTYELVVVVTGSDGRKYSGRCWVTVL